MIELSVYIITIVILLSVNVFVYFYAKKKGKDEFLEILFLAGFMGKVDAFKHYNKYVNKQGIVFVGDSITQDFNVYEYFLGKNVYNRGIGGDTSKGLLERLDESIFKLAPKKVFIQIGTNDFQLLDTNCDEVFMRIQEVVNKILEFDEKIKVYLISVYPVNYKMDQATVGKRDNLTINNLNNLLKTIKSVQFIDIYGKLLDGDVLNSEYSLEGLHLNQKGYEVVREALLPYIEE